MVEQYGVSFELTDDIEKELRKLGAGDRLLLVIAKNHVQPAPNVTTQPPSPQPTPPGPQSATTWTDPATGLMWTKESNSTNVTWNQAKDYCANLHLGGYSNWRLATIDELSSKLPSQLDRSLGERFHIPHSTSTPSSRHCRLPPFSFGE